MFKLTLTTIGMMFLTSFLFGHSPDLSSLMVYEQNEKNFIAIKSSLSAFEGEVIYHYGKDSYKTPQEFSELAIKHFKKSCIIVINKDTIKFSNLQVQLGHETTIFAELENVPQKITFYHVKNIFFKDMPNNQCELILSHKDLPQKQIILQNKNKHEVKFRIEKNKWTIDETNYSFLNKNHLFLWGSVLLICGIAILILKKRSYLQP